VANNSTHGSGILKAGDYKVDKFTLRSAVNGNSVDLRGVVVQFEVFEDIFSPYLTAKLYVEDTLNLPERIPISGQEIVEIGFKSDIDSFKFVNLKFRVYKLDNQQLGENGKSQTYTLHLISMGGYLNYSQYCGYSVKGKTSTMVETIFSKHFPSSVWKDRLFVEPTSDNYSFVLSGGYTPFKAINWLTSKASNEHGKGYSPYFFYETLDGYSFKSLNRIIADGAKGVQQYTYMPPNLNVPDSQPDSVPFASVLPPRYHKIQMMEDVSRFDMANGIATGVISSKLLVHDLIRKQQRVQQFFERDVFDAKPKLGTEVHFKKETTEASEILDRGASFFYGPSTPYTVYSEASRIVDNFGYESLFLKKKHHLNSLLSHKINVLVSGDSRRRVGDVVRLNISKIQSDSFLDPLSNDKNLGGDYVITSIRHQFNTTYTCKFELSKTCMGV
jgi:hypothetical protein